MKTFNITISYPQIKKASTEYHSMLRAVYNASVVQKLLGRLDLKGEIKESDNQGPLFIILNVPEQNVNAVETNVIGWFGNQIDSSHGLRQFISSKNVKIVKESNFDKMIKKLPELEGIF
jgi:hypothetical protein